MDLYLKMRKKMMTRKVLVWVTYTLAAIALITFNMFDYEVPIIISDVVAVITLCWGLLELLNVRIYYAEIDGEDIIIDRGAFLVKLLVNGEEQDTMFGKSYMEAKLGSGVGIVVCAQAFLSYHIMFSDGRKPIDL